MHVELISPPYEDLFGLVKKASPLDPPLGLAYIAALLEKNGIKVGIIDCEAEKLSIKQTVEEIKARSPDIIGFTTTTPTMPEIYEISELVRKTNEEIVLVAGGPHATAEPTRTLTESEINVVVRMEGEETIIELVKTIEENGNLKEVGGISYKKRNRVYHNPDREPVKDLDLIPFPARHLLNIRNYIPAAYTGTKDSIYTSIMATRGCYYKCIFCGQSSIFKGVRFRSAKNVVDEIEEVIDEYGVDTLEFMDATFVANPKFVMEVCNEILNRKIYVRWAATGRVNIIGEKLLKKMREAGCIHIYYGIESGNQRILDFMKKNITLEQARKSVRETKKAGISTTASFILGLPTETRETIEESINFAIKLDPTYASFSIATPYPGTRFYEIAKREGFNISDWSEYKLARYGNPIYHPKDVSIEELKRTYSNAFRRFYFRPSYLLERLLEIKSPSELKHNLTLMKELIL